MNSVSRLVNTVIEAVGVRRYIYVAVVTLLIYLLILALSPVLKTQSVTISAVPVLVAAWYFRFRGAVVITMIVFALNILILNFIGNPGNLVESQIWSVFLVCALVGMGTSCLRENYDHVQSNSDGYQQFAKELQQSEMRYRTLIENTGDFVARFDRELRHLYVNPALLTSVGLTLEDYLGKTNQELKMPEINIQQWNAHILHVFETGEEDRFEFSYETVYGFRYFESRLFPENIVDGKPETVISVVRDITPRKLSEDQRLQPVLEGERVRVLAQFVTHISHDIRTPLSIIKTSAYLAERNNNPERQKSHFEKIDTSVDHITRVIDAIATIAKLDTNELFQFSKLNLDSFSAGLYGRFQSIAESKNVQLILDCESHTRLIKADGNYLGQAISNLLYNAIWHCRPEMQVTLRIWQDDLQTYIEVCDQGNGIDVDDLPHIFERFYRSDQARTINEFTGGTGLGLSITKEIIKRHKGTIEVDNTPGKGARFRVMLPDDPKAVA